MKPILQEVVQKVNTLFVTTRYKYLLMNRDGDYSTINSKDNEKLKSLSDWMLHNHLEGKSTYGVFGMEYGSKFLTFDVDIPDENKSKMAVYKIVSTLTYLGIPENRIYINHSGNKGYHIDLYFSDVVSTVKLNEFYRLVMDESEFNTLIGTNGLPLKHKYMAHGGEVEQRPVGNTLGVKLPLGKHFGTFSNKRCYYVDYNDYLKPIKDHTYFMNIEQLDREVIYSILDAQKDLTLEGEEITEKQVLKVEETKNEIKQKYNPLEIYKHGVDPEVTIAVMEKLEHEGLTQTGMRNNSIWKLAIYYRYLGMTQEECHGALISWMGQQDTRTYSTKWQDVMKEIDHISNYVYVNDLSIVSNKRNVEVNYDEMLEIIKLKTKNEKLLAYCLLIHAKRYGTKTGIFYMTYDQMVQTSGLVEKTTRNIIPKLEEQNAIEIVERNRKQKGTFKKKPNKYKVNIVKEESPIKTITVDCEEVYKESFVTVVNGMFDKNELKKLLPRRQYEDIISGSI